jgi:hypothetical protein
VVIDRVAEGEIYRNHHMPAMYGFQSRIIAVRNLLYFHNAAVLTGRSHWLL